MKAVIQRVSAAKVKVGQEIVGQIESGLLIFLGIVKDDTQNDMDWLCNKISNIRIFNDDQGIMNLSLKETQGQALVVSQFTLHALTKKGNRPSYIKAAKPYIALPLYEQFIEQLQSDLNQTIQTGTFGADMKVELLNDGPVTLIIDTKNRE